MGDWGKHFLMRLSGLNRDFVCGRAQESLRPQGGRTEVAALGLRCAGGKYCMCMFSLVAILLVTGRGKHQTGP